MRAIRVALTTLVVGVVAFVVSHSLGLTVDTVAVLLILATAPAATLFAILYGTTTPWWRTMIGRALMVSSTALALLVDISLLYQWLGDNYVLRDAVRLTVFSLVCAGAWLKLTALLNEKWHAHKARRSDRLEV